MATKADLESDLAAMTAERDSVRAALEATTSERDQVKTALDTAERDLANANARIGNLQSNIDRVLGERDKARDDLSAMTLERDTGVVERDAARAEHVALLEAVAAERESAKITVLDMSKVDSLPTIDQLPSLVS